jgi:hypothetical protein
MREVAGEARPELARIARRLLLVEDLESVLKPQQWPLLELDSSANGLFLRRA